MPSLSDSVPTSRTCYSVWWLLAFAFLNLRHRMGIPSRHLRTSSALFHSSGVNVTALPHIAHELHPRSLGHVKHIIFCSTRFHRVAANSLSGFSTPHCMHVRNHVFFLHVAQMCVSRFLLIVVNSARANHCLHREHL